MRLERSQQVVIAFVVASGLISFWNLWGRSLENHGYIRYAEIAREMLRSGDWIVSRLNGEVYIDKPPLLFWLIALPSSLHGSVTPLIARLPSAISAWIGVMILFFWAKRVHGTIQSGLIAGGVLISSYQYFFQSRLAKTDMLFCLFVLLALYFFHLGYGETEKGRKYAFYGFSFFSIGLGTLTKGPFGLFITFLIVSIFLIKERRWRILFSREFLFGYAILAVAVLPWVLLFVGRVGWQECITLIRENKILSRHAPFYLYFVQIWGQFSPWSIFIPFLFYCFCRKGDKIWNSGESLFIIWFVALFIALTLFKFRTSRYLLPALPPFALMLGGMWKKRLTTFLVLFLLAIFAWHGREIIWTKKDLSYSPGMVLVNELKPFVKEKALLTYRLDDSTVEEINFYLDPALPIPLLKEIEYLDKYGLKGEKAVLMPRKIYEDLKGHEDNSILFIHEFNYKKERLVLALY